TALDTHGVRTILARPSGARRESAYSERGGLVPSRHVWVAACGPSAGIGRHGQMTDVSTLLQWDLEALGQGVLPNFGVPMEEAWEFVCTHGKRDVCCATSGRGYALARQAAAPDAHVRECSHLGGHRFAPTCLFLPSGRLYGRLDAAGFYPAGSEPSAEFLRGASYLSPAAQAADQAVRSALAMPANARTYLRVGPDGACENSTTVNVETADNGTWHVTCTDNTIEAPASCGAPPTVRTVWQAEIAGAPSGVHPDNP
ncbi:MAG: sucrase ferredoxin, partial [Actinomycetota bacterium]|nr:sucrase ferredoxin [Actinomycetota bacterium]